MLQKKCKKCLEADKFPLKDLLLYIFEVLDTYDINPVIWQFKKYH